MIYPCGLRYPNLWARLMGNIEDVSHEGACWVWARKKGKGGYGHINLHVPSLGKIATLKTHVVAFALSEIGFDAKADDVYLAYKELIHNGYELHHRCFNPSCLNVDHLELLTPAENLALRREPYRP